MLGAAFSYPTLVHSWTAGSNADLWLGIAAIVVFFAAAAVALIVNARPSAGRMAPTLTPKPTFNAT